jgi:hypothetical protein
MRGKRRESEKRKDRLEVPSSGWGAASAMDALIRRRVTPPGHANAPQQPSSKKQ